MQLPRLNGEVDAEEVAEIIVTHILTKVANVYDHRIDNEIVKELREYTKDKIELVKKETTSR